MKCTRSVCKRTVHRMDTSVLFLTKNNNIYVVCVDNFLKPDALVDYLIHGVTVQSTDTFPIGDHVNVLHDCKKTRPSNILKLLNCFCHH